MYMQIHVHVSCFSCSQKCKGRHVATMVIVILYGTLCDHHLNNAIGPIVSESHAIQRLNEMVQASCCENLLWKYKGASYTVSTFLVYTCMYVFITSDPFQADRPYKETSVHKLCSYNSFLGVYQLCTMHSPRHWCHSHKLILA